MTNFKTVFLSSLGNILPVRCQWCGKAATHLLTRIDKDGNVYSDSVCPGHASEWEKYRQGTQLELEIE